MKTEAAFNAFRVRQDTSRREMGSGRDTAWSNTVWLAPDVKTAVKLTSTDPRMEDWELGSDGSK